MNKIHKILTVIFFAGMSYYESDERLNSDLSANELWNELGPSCERDSHELFCILSHLDMSCERDRHELCRMII